MSKPRRPARGPARVDAPPHAQDGAPTGNTSSAGDDDGGKPTPSTEQVAPAARDEAPGGAAATGHAEDAPHGRHVASEELVRELTERLAIQRSAEIHGLLEILGRKRKLFAINLLAGLARGVGFFLGITLVGGLVIGATAMAFDFVAETFGLHDVNFTSLMRRFAEKAVEAERVWEDVRAEQHDEDSPEVRAARPSGHEAAPPLDTEPVETHPEPPREDG
ncbi:MAG: hypothetical protein H6825_05990 [Planctomycetes bacterium]|nr:hypothetical protein [Planctomycetota bacterium]